MSRRVVSAYNNEAAPDDELSITQIRTLSGGENNRQDAQNIKDNEAAQLRNVDIGIDGIRIERPGLTLLEDIGVDSIVGLNGIEPIGETNILDSIVLSGTDTAIYRSYNAAAFSKVLGSDNIVDTDNPIAVKVFKAGGDGDVTMVGSKTTNWHEIKQDGTVTDLGNEQATGWDSPPRSNVGEFYNGRFWVLYDNYLAFGDAYADDYEANGTDTGAFDTQATGNVYKMPVGEARFLIGIREKGLICGGNDEIRYIQPSPTPAATDVDGILVKDGCVANRSAVLAGDDILYMAKDGVRGVYKTAFDTLQYKTSQPLSYRLKDELDIVNWAYIQNASAAYFDNKYFLSLPVNSSTTNNRVWVYYPATDGWMVITGWNVEEFTVLQVSGEDRLYASDALDGKVYRAWLGTSDNGTNISYSETSKKLELGSPYQEKVGQEVIVRAKATGLETVNVYASFDESEFNKIGELVTEDRSTNFASWTLPLLFQDAGIYTKKFHIDTYGEWYQMQIKLEHVGDAGGDLKILQTAVIAKKNRYFSEDTE